MKNLHVPQPGYRAGEFCGRIDGIPIKTRSAYWARTDFMPPDFAEELLRWCINSFDLFGHTGNPLAYQSSASVNDLVVRCPTVEPLLDAIIGEMVDACNACDVDAPPLPVFVEAWGSQRGEGDHFHWHTDRDPKDIQTRVLSFCYYLPTEPMRFMGGELEFFDGVMIPPVHNMLVLFDPNQIHRVRHVHVVPHGWGGSDEDDITPATWPDSEPVHMIDSRWNVIGWIHTRELVAEGDLV